MNFMDADVSIELLRKEPNALAWIVSSEAPLRSLFAREDRCALHFIYWCQVSPEAIAACLREGRELPIK